MNRETAKSYMIGDNVIEGGQVRRIMAVELGRIAGPHFRLSGYSDSPGESLTSYALCSEIGPVLSPTLTE